MIMLPAKSLSFILGVAGMALLGQGLCRGEDQMDAATKARVEQFEKGATSIDVSKYPDGIKENYEVFAQKCAQCHKLSRPINADYVLPDEWSRYVKRMMYKPGSNISGSEAKKLYDFLVFDSSVRKKDKLDAKLAAIPADERKKAEAKIKEVADKYGK